MTARAVELLCPASPDDEFEEGDTDEDQGLLQQPDSEQQSAIVQAVLAGFTLEFFLCCVAEITFTNSTNLWVTLVVFMMIRAVCLPFVCGCTDPNMAITEFMKAMFFFNSIWPFMYYVVFLDWDFIYSCELEIDEVELKTLTWDKPRVVKEPKIACNEPDWLVKGDLVEWVPLVIQFVVPFLFASIFLSSASFFGANLKRNKTTFQVAILDYFDIANFATIALSLQGWVWFDANPRWFIFFLSCVVVAWIASVVEVSVGLLKSLTRKVAESMLLPTRCLQLVAGEKGFAFVSLCFIELPLGLVRTYFVWCGIEIDTIFLGKNALCTAYLLATLCDWGAVKTFLKSLISWLPGAEEVDAAQESLDYQIQQSVLKSTKIQLDEAGRAKEKLKKDADRQLVAYQEQLQQSLRTKLEQVMFLLTLIDKVRISEDMPPDANCGDYYQIKHRVFEAFTSFDDDGTHGKLSAKEINESAFAFAGREAKEQVVRFFAFVQEDRDKSDDRFKAFSTSEQMPIDVVVEEFMKWRCKADSGKAGEEDDEENVEDS